MTSFVRKREKPRSYYFEIELNSKRRQISKDGFAKKSDAKSAMTEAIVDYEQRNFLNISKVRLDRFFEDWLENTVRLLRQLLHRAAQLRLIRDNPCEYIDRPKRVKSTTEVLTEPEMLAVVNALDLHNASNYIFHVGFLFTLETGCRRGEMCGLE